MSHITTHILDAALGGPARGVAVTLAHSDGTEIATGATDVAGRIKDLGPERLETGAYRLIFDTGGYFARGSRDTFYPVVVIDFSVNDAEQHYHVPLLISPFSYSTYRGN